MHTYVIGNDSKNEDDLKKLNSVQRYSQTTIFVSVLLMLTPDDKRPIG